MSRYRNIFCAIWSDDKFPFLSDDAQLVWFHLYTNEFTNAVGIYKAPIEGLAADKRWPLERYRKGFGECSEKGLVEYDERFHVIAFPRFFDWNKPSNPNVLSSWLPAWQAVPRCNLKTNQQQRLAVAAKGWGEGFEKVAERFGETLPPTFGEPSPKQEQEQEQEQDIKDPPEPPADPKPKKRRPAKRCPADFEVTDDMCAWASEQCPGIDVEHETAKFRDHEFASAKTDWAATWRNWMRKATPTRSPTRLGMARPAPADAFAKTDEELARDQKIVSRW
ncbi:MAG: hypothetical protein RJQ08_13395 [Salinisphaeraceae bacterium]